MPKTTTEGKFVELVRKFLRDHPILNKLIKGNETNNTQIRTHLEDALDDWNTTPPILAPVTFDTHPSRRLLIRSAVIETLTSAGILQSRNRLQYSDGGITVQVSDKAAEYQSWISLLVNDYERKKERLKKSQNLELGYGGIHSEYFGDRDSGDNARLS